jgi:phosphatidylglycerophosphate synthase
MSQRIEQPSQTRDWRTKPTDRFVLRWIKVHLSAQLTPLVARIPGIRPAYITLLSAMVGLSAGAAYAVGHAALAAAAAALAQVLDGVDGQLARLTGRPSRAGALLDSCLDRYVDAAMVVGSALFVVRWGKAPLVGVVAACFLALVGSNLVSYSAARAEALGIDVGKPTLASKGSRMALLVLGAVAANGWAGSPLVVLALVALVANAAVVGRLWRASRQAEGANG